MTKIQLRDWLSESRTYRVLAALAYLAKNNDDADLQNAVLLQSAQLSDWQKAKASGTLSQDELTALRNRIHANLMYSIDQLPDGGPLSIPSGIFEKADAQDGAMPKPVSDFKKWILLSGGVLAVLLIFLLVKNQMSSTFTQTILVKDKKGDLILQNQGKVVLSSAFGLDSAKIGDNGEALFNLSANKVGEKVRLSISHELPYQVLDLNQTYALHRNQPINLVVTLGNLDKLEGEIIDATTEKPLDSVRVSIKNIATYTDKNGWFKLNIPASEREPVHRVVLDKEGYNRLPFDNVPIVLGKQLRFSMTRIKQNK